MKKTNFASPSAKKFKKTDEGGYCTAKTLVKNQFFSGLYGLTYLPGIDTIQVTGTSTIPVPVPSLALVPYQVPVVVPNLFKSIDI